MLIWLVLAIIAVVGGGLVAYRVGRQRGLSQALPPASAAGVPALGGNGVSTPLLERTIADLKVDDVVQRQGRDWLVEGLVRYEEDGHVWNGARIIDAAEEAWLFVGLDRGPGGPSLRLLKAVTGIDLAGYPPETLQQGETRYQLSKRGTATAQFIGSLGPIPSVPAGTSLRCRWWRYQAVGERCLLVEQWGDVYRVLVGESIRPEDCELLAAS